MTVRICGMATGNDDPKFWLYDGQNVMPTTPREIVHRDWGHWNELPLIIRTKWAARARTIAVLWQQDKANVVCLPHREGWYFIAEL